MPYYHILMKAKGKITLEIPANVCTKEEVAHEYTKHVYLSQQASKEGYKISIEKRDSGQSQWTKIGRQWAHAGTHYAYIIID